MGSATKGAIKRNKLLSSGLCLIRRWGPENKEGEEKRVWAGDEQKQSPKGRPCAREPTLRGHYATA